ncbi:transposase [Tibeticola sp.]|uniref:transposase n=1 Tax=Tibeticola sp. TaxID=2005368 RepID=UPI0025DFF3A9|nr:transposase [Tibeticola sp.]
MVSKRRGPYRQHPLAQKRAIVEHTLQPGASVAQIARKLGVNANPGVFGARPTGSSCCPMRSQRCCR